ncbi:MAG TPA: ATP-dependent DNA ligase [Pseudolysinimonas sp.]|nr:ATP-dependent DNA ligase [Pseudolysinimonas sp.]
MAGEQVVEVGGRRIKLTNLDKVLYPETGTTKAEVLDYYSRVAEVMIPHAADRPATRKRWPNGVDGQMFFEKQLPAHAPDWVRSFPIQHSDGPKDYPLINDLPTLIWLAQMAALELHVPQWRFDRDGARLGPDRLVLDLDPGEGAGLAECVEVAKLVRVILQGMGLEPLPVTSGSKGIHLYAALDGTQTSEQVSAVAKELARILESQHPDLIVSDMKKALRGGKVLIDWSQNNGSKTTILPYSLRGRSRPTVAAPRTWKELDSPRLAHLEFTEVLKRLPKGDPLAALDAGRVDVRLGRYRSMRDPAKTPEPMGGAAAPGSGDSFVIQEHHTPGRVHYDFRLEKNGVLVSWAVPKNVPTDPGQNHLAVHTEDHPLAYGSFEGTIPRGEYGAGTVSIWDHGTYEEEKFSDDEVVVILHGQKLQAARLALIRTGGGSDSANWLMHLMKDQRKGVWSSGRKPATASARLRRTGKTVVGTRTGGAQAIQPMLATLGDPESFGGGPEWAYEMKWDGYRAIATVSGDEAALRSRNGLDFTPMYPELAGLAEAVGGDAVLDGEIVALDPAGRPSFELLQGHAVPVRFYVFDVLRLGTESLTSRPYNERRQRLRAAVRDTGAVVVPPDAGADLTAALATSRRLGLEGVMAKRHDSPYREGRRSRDWIKLKHTRTQEVVIGGWRPGKGARSETIGSLLFGIPEDGVLRYAGRVGTGFSDAELGRLRARLDGLARSTPALEGVPRADARDANWVTPTLVGEVVYAERTSEGRLRAPAWKGWRPDKDASDVVPEV